MALHDDTTPPTSARIPSAFVHPAFGRCIAEPTRAAIRWHTGVEAPAKDALLKELDLVLATTDADERRPIVRVNQTDGLSWVRVVDGAALDDARLQRLAASELVEWVSVAYRAERSTRDVPALFCVNPARVYVRQATVDAAGGIAALGATVPLEVARTERLRGYVSLDVAPNAMADGPGAIAAAAQITSALRAHAHGGTAAGANAAGGRAALADVRFENIPYLSPECHGGTAVAPAGTATMPATDALHGPYRPEAGPCGPPTSELTPNDPDFGTQWGLQRINAPRGWRIARGAADVTVAVIDLGVELAHPDLDLHPQSWNASTDTPDGSPTGNHGTACAGIVGARLDNGLGIAGVAGGVQTMAIATATWADVDIVEGLYFAADNGARVVSMSFGVYASWMMWDFAIIQDALQYAHDKGLVLVAASGNEDIPTSRFPGSDARTITVGGSNRSDERKRAGDASSEPFWGACYGADLDVVAPCLEIPTTDRFGLSGYAAGDYFDRFNGTSAATPHVAGLAALIVSLRPSLTNADVRQLIESTCDKISPATYAYANVGTKPNGPWNDEVGYGRINVERALLAACALGHGTEPECDGCGGACIEEIPADCQGPVPVPWLPLDRCMTFYESRVFDTGRVQIRVTYEHCLHLLGRQQGPLLYTQTLLPGEEVRLYTFDRYRRVRSHTEQMSVHASFRQTMSALSQSRWSTSSATYVDVLVKTRNEKDSSLSIGGGLAGFFGAPSGTLDESSVTATTIGSGSAVQTVAEQFTQLATTASQSLEAERAIVVSTYEEAEHQATTQRTFRNENHCYAVTYFVRRVNEVYHASSRVVSVEWRLGVQGPFRAAHDLADVKGDLRERIADALRAAPRVGEQAADRRQVTIPTDGLLYEPELAHCSSCEPTREAAERIRIERLRQENRRLCIEADAMALELERHRTLVRLGRPDRLALPWAAEPHAALPATTSGHAHD